MDFKNEIIKILKSSVKEHSDLFDEKQLELPKDQNMGDFALPCFIFSKEMKRSPVEIAKEISEKIKLSDAVSEVNAIGPYLNFKVNKSILAKEVLDNISKQKNKYGFTSVSKSSDSKSTLSGQKMMIEFSSPNTNKPLHLGHIRNCFLGDSVSKICSAAGNDVVKSCLVNDRGVHICKSMIAYQKFSKFDSPESAGKKGDHFVGDMYVLFAKHESDELNEEAQKMLQAWESGDKETVALWKKMNTWVYSGFDETYKRMNVSFDKFYYESDIYKFGKDIVQKGLKDKKLYEKEGAIYAPLEDKYNIPDKVLLRSNGTSVYMTQDIYLAIKKFKDFGLNKSVYVVGSEQNLHFKQLFSILETLGYDWGKNCHHLSYGMVYLPEGKMKSREGKVVDADDLIEEMVVLAKAEIKKRDEKISDKELDDRARKIALGGLKFFMLRIDPNRDMTYDPKESISFEGETGPYVQYVSVRINSILEKYAKKLDYKIDYSLFNEVEGQIISSLDKFSDVVIDAARSYKPSLICNYLIKLSQDFNGYYHKHHILNETNDEIKKARLVLINSIRTVIVNGLSLLGIDVPDRM